MPDAEKNTEYAGNYVYSDNESVETMKLQFINHPEGYIEPVANTFKSKKRFRFGIDGGGTTTYSSYNYVFQYKDHLGNVRLSYSDADLNGSIDPSSEIIEESNYYPFGLKQQGYNNVITSTNPAQKFKYNQGTSGTNFQGKEGKSFKVERQLDLGLNVDMTKFRMYDYALGRFTSIDPLADTSPQESWTPYQYAYNSPIQYNDPNGDCPPWICGALAGGLVEAGSQYIANIARGDSWTDAAKEIDGADVLAATIEGGSTGGGSVARRFLVKGVTMVASEIVKATVDAEIGDVVDEGLNGVEIESDGVEIVKDVAIGVTSNLIGDGVEGAMKAVVNSKHTKELTKVSKELKKSMKGSKGESVRKTKQSEIQSTIKGNKVVSEATGTVTTEVVDEKLGDNR